MRSHVSRKRGLAVGVLLVLACAATVTVAAPAQAEVDSSDCAEVAYGDECFEHELLSSQIGVPVSGEEKILEKEPSGTGQDAITSVAMTKTDNYKITNAVSQADAFAWSFGLMGGGEGSISVPVIGSANLELSANGGITASGTRTVTRTDETSITWTATYTVSHPAVPVRRGYAIYTSIEGNKYEVNQRRCERKVWGLWCDEWQTMTVEVPTGLNIREQGLGWTASLFHACAPTGTALYTKHYDVTKIGTLSNASCLHIDFTDNTWWLSSTAALYLNAGTFTTTSVDLNAVFDPDRIVVELQGNSAGGGTVTITRDPLPIEDGTTVPGNTKRSGQLDSELLTFYQGALGIAVPGWSWN
jgi:hypothetical protein